MSATESNITITTTKTNNNNEQPQTKRQKIEKLHKKHAQNTTTTTTTTEDTKTTKKLVKNDKSPPDILENALNCATTTTTTTKNHHHHHHHDNNNDENKHSCTLSISTPSSRNNSPISTPSSSRAASLSHLLNVQNLIACNNNNNNSSDSSSISSVGVANSQTPVSNCCSSSACSSADEVDRVTLTDLLPITITNTNNTTTTTTTNDTITTTAEDMREFESSLTRQCLCGVSERTLRKPFQSHYSMDSNGHKRIANLNEWPVNKLLQFLSNLQLLFDIYLKQNSKGFICARIMDVCDALIRNDHNLIDEIIVLSAYGNVYVQFLASRVLAAFLVIAKQQMDDNWLKKLVDNLFNFENLDALAVQKIHFSLEIIKRIVEWKDIDLHPLEDEIHEQHQLPSVATMTTNSTTNSLPMHIETNVAAASTSTTHAYMHFHAQQPSIENNYFAVHFRNNNNDNVVDDDVVDEDVVDDDDDDDDAVEEAAEEIALRQRHNHNTATTITIENGCHIITLTDSESFDTTHLKCVTIKILENKWPALVKNMSTLIAQHIDVENAENCVLNFLQLWENIISVKANLSIVETLPFYAQLDKFEMLLNQPQLSCSIYKQMLCLFNEALCYGSTLALQDMLPDETCYLAHQIVRHVKDFRILDSLPRRQPENLVGLLGFKLRPIVYMNGSISSQNALVHVHNTSSGSTGEVLEMDKTILQKMVLLVLKSIAVTVKEIRSDSSDSSIDSSDYEAFQDMVLIERSIRDVLRKLETFIKHKLEFHPESHFSKILIHLFDDQDDHLIEAMVCTLDVTAGISFRNNAFHELVAMLNPVYTFLEFLKIIANSSDLLLDLLVSNETCFLLYLLRFLKYIRMNWHMFVQSCHDFGLGAATTLDDAMSVLIRLRLQISRLVSRQLYPYDISPVLRLLESCESLYEGNELS